MPTDSAYISLPLWIEADTAFCADLDSALAVAPVVMVQEEAIELPPPPPDWMSGKDGLPRVSSIGSDSGVLAIITGIFLLMMLSYKRSRRLFANLWQELLGMRQRANAFDERTSGETTTLVLMAMQLSLCLGLLLYSAICMGGDSALLAMLGVGHPPERVYPESGIFLRAIKLIALMGGYYLVQLAAYYLVGYTFADSGGQRLFIKGFTSSQSLLSFTLVVPALVAIFYPAAAPIMIILAVFLYLLARFIFIAKGLRIFYTNFGSLFYFILYLCALEFIPLLIVYRLAISFVGSPMMSGC